MENQSKPEKYLDAVVNVLDSTPVKIIMIVGTTYVLIYIAGMLFEVMADTMVSYKKFDKASKL